MSRFALSASETRTNLIYDVVLIRYGEIGLKGRNRPQFENRLVQNIRSALSDYPGAVVRNVYGRLVVRYDGSPGVLEALQRVFGIVSLSPAARASHDLEAIQEAALRVTADALAAGGVKSFKVEARRADKSFPVSSMDLNQLVGGAVHRAWPDLQVRMRDPDLRLRVEVRPEAVYISARDIAGLGGLPVGVSSKAVLLLSGGIDSPVAGWLAMKRGIALEALHFHSFPYTSERSLQKAADLRSILERYGGPIRLHVAPFTRIQEALRQRVTPSLWVTVMRRFMMRIAERIAEATDAVALVTGESVGQVASQTLESLRAIEAVTPLPVLRPLIAMDKVEIVEKSKAIGSYETSILPYEDCCTVFVPDRPQTRPDLAAVERAEAALDVEALVADAVAGTEVHQADE